MAIRLLLMGAPGTGKGVISRRIKRKYKVKHISVGQILRDEIRKKSALGLKVKEYVERGDLAPNLDVVGLLKKNLPKKQGFILDGFPRNIQQARSFEPIRKRMKDIKVVYLKLPIAMSIKRLSGRVQCSKCHKIYNLITLRPKNEGVCGKCGGKLVFREDDSPTAIRERMKVYNIQIVPVIEYYKRKGILRVVDDIGTIPEVLSRVYKVLEKK